MLSRTEIPSLQQKILASSKNSPSHQTLGRKNYLNNSSDSARGDYNLTTSENPEAIKQSLRKRFIDQRLLLSEGYLAESSSKIADHLFNHPAFLKARSLALYSPIRSEVDTTAIFNKSRELGKKTYYPRVCKDILVFHEIVELSNLKPGKFDIMEPNESNTSTVNPDQIDLFIIPAVCVDKKGHRIGYGKGYYDRTLKNISSNKKIVLAFDLQIIDSITPQNFDRNVDFIATQKGVINTTKGDSE